MSVLVDPLTPNNANQRLVTRTDPPTHPPIQAPSLSSPFAFLLPSLVYSRTYRPPRPATPLLPRLPLLRTYPLISLPVTSLPQSRSPPTQPSTGRGTNRVYAPSEHTHIALGPNRAYARDPTEHRHRTQPSARDAPPISLLLDCFFSHSQPYDHGLSVYVYVSSGS